MIVPFLVQISTAVGLVGWLSFQNGQKAIETLAQKLQREIGQRIEAHLRSYTNVPVIINQINTDLVRSGQLSLEDLPELNEHFLRQLFWFPEVSYIAWGSEQGEFAGAFRDPEDQLTLALLDDSTNRDLITFRTDQEGNVGTELDQVERTSLILKDRSLL